MIIDLGFLVQSIMRFGFLIWDGNEVDKVTEKLQGVGIASGSADGAVLTTSKGKEQLKRFPGGKIKKKLKLPNLIFNEVKTPLQASIHCGSWEIVEHLLKAGADPNGLKALLFAAEYLQTKASRRSNYSW
ncbi:hypothetical protein MKW98_004255 [Papaver atlanticum]|uniref:Uncharacterized protein n=1 Tax=Papaver atlanticum TaxID=357466 RepID=A0AAD4XTH5_9MAGN|nr:hypothetical protein MKW98_004255 [Papaver atlanticum]